jgi:spore germination protein YaaH
MRKLFANPHPFITKAIAEAKKNGYIGYHIDFEPEHGVLRSDAPLYATFVDLFASALHKVLKILVSGLNAQGKSCTGH